MQTPPKQNLIDTIRLNNLIIHRQLRDLTHEETLLQPPFQANCMNWVLGHLLTGRDGMLSMLQLPKVLSAQELATYDRGSAALSAESNLDSPFNSLKARLDQSLEQIIAALESLPEESLAENTEFGGKGPLGGEIAFLLWHETYHTGQLELLRQVAGKNDQVIK
jgi:uncharacterized damage-inducible protein DinB